MIVWDVRWNIHRFSHKIIGQIKAHNIDIALGLARKKYGHHVSVEGNDPNHPFKLIPYEQTQNAVDETDYSVGEND